MNRGRRSAGVRCSYRLSALENNPDERKRVVAAAAAVTAGRGKRGLRCSHKTAHRCENKSAMRKIWMIKERLEKIKISFLDVLGSPRPYRTALAHSREDTSASCQGCVYISGDNLKEELIKGRTDGPRAATHALTVSLLPLMG